MKQKRLIALLILWMVVQIDGAAIDNQGGFRLRATMTHLLRDTPGELYIGSENLSFRSDDSKTKLEVPWRDIREAHVSDVRRLRFALYEPRKWEPLERQEFVFRAHPDAPVEDIARMLSARVHRPVVGHYAAGSAVSVAAFHKRALRGTSGTLEIGVDAIRYVSQEAADSRTWLYRDIQTIGRPDAFRFRVTTIRETYVLELKEPLPEAAFQTAWEKIYAMETAVK